MLDNRLEAKGYRTAWVDHHGMPTSFLVCRGSEKSVYVSQGRASDDARLELQQRLDIAGGGEHVQDSDVWPSIERARPRVKPGVPSGLFRREAGAAVLLHLSGKVLHRFPRDHAAVPSRQRGLGRVYGRENLRSGALPSLLQGQRLSDGSTGSWPAWEGCVLPL
jgi:hypothetical protein